MSVTLVGAGPGDRGLLTLKGAEHIENADVVLYDRFISEEILAMIPASAEKISVGKHAGSHSMPQEAINRLLLEKARQGLRVVRLKGGDPFVFGRGGEELEFLAENGIPFEIVPGVTSAIAGPAYAGIPVTHRDYVSSLHIITGHAKNKKIPDIDYEALVRTKGTLVFLMSVAAVDAICENCIAAGMDRNMPAAIIENASLNFQRKFLGTVKTLASIAHENAVVSPAIIVIGEVCRFSGRYDWFSRKLQDFHSRFTKRIIVVRGKPGASRLSDMLGELGFQAIGIQCFSIVPLTGPGCVLEKIIAAIQDYSWLVFTSSVGVNVFFDYLIHSGCDIRMLGSLKTACVGSETEKEIQKRGIKVDYRPSEYNGASLARGLAALVKKGEKLLIPRAKAGEEELTRILVQEGIVFDDVPVYEKTIDMERTRAAVSMATENRADFAAFTSSSAVECFAKASAGMDLSAVKAVCIGERTAAAAKSYGMEVYVSAQATVESMVEKIKELA